MVRFPGGIRYTPADLNWNNRNIAGGGGGLGTIVPWRTALNFRAVICRLDQDAGTVNAIPRIYWVDWDGVTGIPTGGLGQPWITTAGGGTILINTSFFCSDATIQALSGTPEPRSMGHIMGAPYVAAGLSNLDAAAHNFTMELELLGY